jgi:hypothetical protein
MPAQKRDREGGGDGRHSRIDKETLNYFAEIDTHFKSLTDDEDRQLLAGNVLGDAAGREADLATDAACSRVLEALLPFASNEALCTFTTACVEGENLGTMCTRCAAGRRAGGGGSRRRRQLAPAVCMLP